MIAVHSAPLYKAQGLGASISVANSPRFAVGPQGQVSFQCVIAKADGTSAPTDTPSGVWELWASADGVTYSKVTTATTELANIAPNGNNVVSAWANFTNVPGLFVKLRYVRTSGGGTDATAFVTACTR